jgi:hypothetical protein
MSHTVSLNPALLDMEPRVRCVHLQEHAPPGCNKAPASPPKPRPDWAVSDLPQSSVVGNPKALFAP